MKGNILCAIAIFGFALCSSASAQTPSPEKLREAYDVAAKCYLADSYAAINREKKHDTERQRFFEEKSKVAWAAGQKLAKALGYPARQFQDDIWARKDAEFSRYTREPGYFPQITVTCKAYGFM